MARMLNSAYFAVSTERSRHRPIATLKTAAQVERVLIDWQNAQKSERKFVVIGECVSVDKLLRVCYYTFSGMLIGF